MLQAMRKFRESRLFLNILPFAVLLVLALFFNFSTNGRFFYLQSLKTIFFQTMITGVIATGAVFIFSSSNVNIAMGGTTAISAIVGIFMYRLTGSMAALIIFPYIAAVIILVIAISICIRFKLSVIMVTILFLGLLSAIQSWVMLKHITLTLPYELIKTLKDSNISIVIFIIFSLVCIFLYNFTKIGRVLKFIGDNPTCARQTGININKYLILSFIIAGIGAGSGAVLTMIRNSAITSTSCAGLNIDVMLAIVLGGMPIFGGYKSRITAGFIGALIVTVLSTGLLMIGVSATILQAVRGACFILLIVISNKRPELLPVRETF